MAERRLPPDGRTALGFQRLRNRAAALLPQRATPLIVSLAVVVTVGLYLWRSGDSALHPQLVAEDGRIFFTEAKLRGVGSLVVPYAGYLHTLPRLGALAAGAFPSPLAPALYLVAASVIVAWSAATIASAGLRHAWILAPLSLLVSSDGEVFGTLTNVQWLTAPALALLVATDTPERRLVRVNQLVFALAASLTGPFSLFAIPLVVWRIASHRDDRFAWALGLTVSLGAAIQSGYVLADPGAASGVEQPLRLAIRMLDRWIGQASHPGRTVRPAHWRDVAALVAAAAVAAATLPGLSARLYCFAVGSLCATFVRFLGDNDYFGYVGAVDRYFYAPRLVILWTLALCLARLRWSSIAGLVGLVLMLAAVDRWQKTAYPHLPWAAAAAAIDRGGSVRIVTNPSTADDPGPGAWAVVLTGRP